MPVSYGAQHRQGFIRTSLIAQIAGWCVVRTCRHVSPEMPSKLLSRLSVTTNSRRWFGFQLHIVSIALKARFSVRKLASLSRPAMLVSPWLWRSTAATFLCSVLPTQLAKAASINGELLSCIEGCCSKSVPSQIPISSDTLRLEVRQKAVNTIK
jgi:hypothetical protein